MKCFRYKKHSGLKFFLSVPIFVSLLVSHTGIFAKTLGKINSDGVNLRSLPTINSGVLKKLPADYKFEILSCADGFYKISYDGTEAYVSEKFVDLLETQGVINGQNINVRSLPDKNSQVLGKLNSGDKIDVIAQVNDWYKVSYNNHDAYVARQFVKCDFADRLKDLALPVNDNDVKKFAVVTSDNGLNMRQGKSTTTDAVCKLAYNSVVDVLDEEKSDWVKVKFQDKSGYVSSDYIKFVDGKDKNNLPVKTKAGQVVEYAKKFIGTPYRYSGRNLRSGVDCSGFVYCVMKDCGVNLNCSSKTQVKNGYEVAKNNLSAGDLVFFSNNGAKDIQHVGIYIGGGNFIHSASKNNKGVTISSLNEKYYVNNYITARRVL